MQFKKPELMGLLVAVVAAVVLYGLFSLFPTRVPETSVNQAQAMKFVLDTTSVRGASIGFDEPNGDFRLDYSLTDEGRSALIRATTGSIGRVLLIEIDGEVVASPLIKDVMTGEHGMIGLPQKDRPHAEALVEAVGKPYDGP